MDFQILKTMFILLVLIALNIKKWFLKHHEFPLKKFNYNFANIGNSFTKNKLIIQIIMLPF
jgi:hypothetical protein